MNTGKMPKWQRELKSFVGIKSAFILEGNIHDVYPVYDMQNDVEVLQGFDDLNRSLVELFHMSGDFQIIFYDPVFGFYGFDGNPEVQQQALDPYLEGYHHKILENGLFGRPCFKIGSKDKCTSSQEAEIKQQLWMSEIVRRGMTKRLPRQNEQQKQITASTGQVPLQGVLTTEKPVIFVLNFASQIESNNVSPADANEMFLNLMAGACDAIQYGGSDRTAVVFLVEKYNDIPAWVYLNNPHFRTISIAKPDMEMRRSLLSSLVTKPKLKQYEALFQNDNEYTESFVAQTEGYMCKEIRDVLELAAHRNILPENIQDALRLYRYGVQDNPWNQLAGNIKQRIHEILQKRVKGQPEAIQSVEEVTNRAVYGLSGLTHSNKNNKPRGIMFFLGPTGVGKTEMAKSLAEALFYDENACLRFDMSEYAAEHADQKLFGAPPGYVGYEGGGQLTNAVKNRPFSILLFDEIEKAHPKIWYKFLQILEDGRMTDNQGTTVHFAETLIIFTSNIGLTKPKEVSVGNGYISHERDRFGNVVNEPAITIQNPMQEDTVDFQQRTDKQLRKAIEEYFNTIGPEVLNRIGTENIVVFRFITVEAAKIICQSKLEKICATLKNDRKLEIDWSAAADYIYKKAVEVRANGGRGVGNMLESAFLNPLGVYLGTIGQKAGKLYAKIDAENEKIVFSMQEEQT